MPTRSAEQCEQLVATSLRTVRAQFERALEDSGEGSNIFTAFDTELHVDQLRRITASAAGGPKLWAIRDGKRCIATTNEVEQGLLSLYVGGNRFVTAEMVFLLLCDIVAGERIRVGETAVAAIVNLIVVEPYLFPERALPICLTVARALASGRDREDLHGILPELSTDVDILHHELPATGRTAARLKPGQKQAESLLTYEMRLLEAIRPDLAGATAGSTEEQRAQLFSARDSDLRAYVREQVFARVAKAVDAAGGSYAVLHPLDDD